MSRRPPRSTRTDTRCPYTTLFRSLLRPGFSLAFAALPAGQDPDDLVRAKVAEGFAAILGDAQPLVERLWAHEVAAAPLATPEERAALKTRSEEHTSVLQSLMRISYAVFCLNKVTSNL